MALSSGSYCALAQDTADTATASAQEDKPSAAVKNGWETAANGKKKYYINGAAVKKKVIKIGKYYYYFNKKGFLVKGKTVKINKFSYHLANSGRIRAYNRKNKFYFPSGKAMSKAQAEDFKCRLKAEKIAEQITNSSMSKRKKLSVCFNWVMKKYYKTHRQSCNVSYWPAVYANDHFANRGGDCHSDAAAFAYLAVAIGYKNVYVCNDSKSVSPNAHAWTEIGGKVYDPLFAQAKSYSANYGVGYGSYKLHPALKVKLDYNKKRPKK